VVVDQAEQSRTLLTISELARRTGVPSRTIRFWSDAGLIPVAERSAAQYRLYDAQALARLELVRTLRELGVGLPAISALLERQKTLGEVAATHISALDARIRALRLQRSVLRVVVRRDVDTKETQRMHKLLQISDVERQRMVDEFVARAFEGIAPDSPGGHIANAMRSVPVELPDDPTDAQVEAWLELASLLSDATFAARVREMAVAGAQDTEPQQPLPVDMRALRELGDAALTAGTAPDAPAAQEILEQLGIFGLSHEAKLRLRERLETFNDVRVERYWQLMWSLHGRPQFPATAAACAWTVAALRARE
jgi:DNA-binding transcriptional MerR regulator